MHLSMLQFETKLQKCIRFRMGIAIFNFFLGDIMSYIRSEITFYSSAGASP